MARPEGQFYLAVAAVIENPQKKILITRRSFKRDHQPGEWELVTGRVKKGETNLIKALRREVRQETGLSIPVAIPFRTFYFERGAKQQPHFGVDFYCPLPRNKKVVVDGKEQIAYEWATPQKAIEAINDPNIKAAVAAYLEFCLRYSLQI